MPVSEARSHRRLAVPGQGWTRVVVAGVVVAVAGTVLTVSIMASNGRGDAATTDTEPKADSQSSSATEQPDGNGDVEDKKSKKPTKDKSKSKDKDKDKDEEGGDSGGGGKSKYPGEGSHDIKAGGLCLGIGPEQGNEARSEVLVLDGCGQASPSTNLRKNGSHTYQITVTKGGDTGCIQVDSPGDGQGLLAAPTGCNGSDQQSFTLDRTGGGFRITVDSGGDCIGPLGGGASDGVAIGTRPCDGDAVFSFEKSLRAY